MGIRFATQVRFFERVKLERRIQKLEKQPHSQGDTAAEEQRTAQLAALRDDLLVRSFHRRSRNTFSTIGYSHSHQCHPCASRPAKRPQRTMSPTAALSAIEPSMFSRKCSGHSFITESYDASEDHTFPEGRCIAGRPQAHSAV